MNEVPLSMALFDFLPNLVFLLGSWLLYRRWCRSGLFLAGLLLVFTNGMTKAVYKLIVALGGPDILWLSQIFIILLPAGFLLLFLASLRQLRAASAAPQPQPGAAHPALLLMAGWKIPFMALATLSALGAYGVWISASVRRRAWLGVAGFALALIATLGMSGISGGEMDQARHWLAEIVNFLGQSCFALGAWAL